MWLQIYLKEVKEHKQSVYSYSLIHLSLDQFLLYNGINLCMVHTNLHSEDNLKLLLKQHQHSANIVIDTAQQTITGYGPNVMRYVKQLAKEQAWTPFLHITGQLLQEKKELKAPPVMWPIIDKSQIDLLS